MATPYSADAYKTIFGAPVNNAGLDPMSGFDADVWAIDQATGDYALVGRFTSIQMTIRNATEPYMEFNQRVPRYLDGEIQIGWVMERGMLDARVLEQTFGVTTIGREVRLSRSPRFQITFELNAPELDNNELPKGELVVSNKFASSPSRGDFSKRRSRGQYVLQFCRVDSLTLGAMAGRPVIANRWEGLAEGISFIDRTNTWAGVTLQDQGIQAEQAIRNSFSAVTGTDLSKPF